MTTGTGIRKNGGKIKASYILMFPNAINILAARMMENENKYPNDAFDNYVPEEILDSLLRHLLDLKNGTAIFGKETPREHLSAFLFNALCFAESAIAQNHSLSGVPENQESITTASRNIQK